LAFSAFGDRAAGVFLAGAEPFLFALGEAGRAGRSVEVASGLLASGLASEGEAGASAAVVFFEAFFAFVATNIRFTDDAAVRK
jgi:hypothetical protein